MGRSKMSSLKITLLPLAICLFLSLNSQVSGKPSPAHFLINTKEKAKKSSDYVNNINNHGGMGSVVDLSTNVDYVNNIKNSGGIGGVVDASTNLDYVDIKVANNKGTIEENNNNHYYPGKK